MTVFVCVVSLVVIGFVVARRRRRSTLAGLDSQRPTFSTTPPIRSLIERKDHRW